jgi:hypothetical protein
MLNGRYTPLATMPSANQRAEALTPEERRQVIGNRGDVYKRYYMPNFADKDCLAI